MRKLPGLIISLALTLLFLSANPSPSHAQQCCPPGETCVHTYLCPGINLACASPQNCPARAACSSTRSLNDDGSQWNVRYCVGSISRDTISSIRTATATCRRVSDTVWNGIVEGSGIPILGELGTHQVCACHEDGWGRIEVFGLDLDIYRNILCGTANAILGTSGYDLAIDERSFDSPPIIGQDPNTGLWYTCFDFLGTVRHAGEVEIEIFDTQGDLICSSRVRTRPEDYSFWEALDGLLGTDLYTDPTERTRYDLKCSTAAGKFGINTAIGCVAYDPVGFTQDFLTISIGVGGSLALLLLLYAAALITLSRGNPQKIQTGRQIIAAVVQGLLLITLSIAMLHFIGINILNLPGLQ